MTKDFKLLIGGKLVTAEKTFSVINPSTGKVFAQAPECSKEHLDEAVQHASKAFLDWSMTPPAKRSEMMLAGAAKVKASVDELADVLVREQGKPLEKAKGEILGVVHYMTHFAKESFAFETVLHDNKREQVLQRRTPLGVVGGIMPWNFPPLMAAWKMAEALMTGNTIVMKPSPYTPLTTLMLGEILADVFPAGVLNVVSGSDDVGRWITEHPDISMISFTGSTRTGKAIQASASVNLKKLMLELGGNDAAIILDDVDAQSTAKGVFTGAMNNCGQICVAVKRCYVHESKFDEVVSHLKDLASNAKIGDGFEQGVQFGPINNKMQFERVKELVEDAKRNGAHVQAGGSALPGDGYFFPPTILTGVSDGVRIVDEEQFGPVLPVMPYKDVSDAVKRVNASQYGLGASVWGKDVERAAGVAGLLESGTVWVNSHGAITPDVPFGGMKQSGIGRQMGQATLEAYTDTKIIRIPKQMSTL